MIYNSIYGESCPLTLLNLEGKMDDFGWVIALFVLLVIGIVVVLVLNIGKSKKIAEQSEQVLAQFVNSLSPEKRTAFMLQVNSVRKDPTTAVLLALFLGGLGAHKFYLGQTGAGIVYLLFCWTSIPALIALIEVFGLSSKVADYNQLKAQEFYRMYSSYA